MNILVFYQYFGTPKGSWSTRYYEFAKRWVAAGNNVTIVTAPYEKSDIKSSKFIERRFVDGIQLIVINTPDSNRNGVFKRAINALLFSIIAVYYAFSETSDLIISSSGPITTGIPGILAKKLIGKPFIFEVRDLWPDGGIEMGKIKGKFAQFVSRRFESILYNGANHIITCSTGQQKHIQNRFPNALISTIVHGCDLELFLRPEFKTNAIQNNPIIYTHIGSLGFIHNVRLIIQAAKIIQDNDRTTNIHIYLIGGGSERTDLEALANSYNLKNLHFVGLLPKNELPYWLHKSTATLFTTLNNVIQNTSSPNKIYDSFAASVPIIQTTTGWIKDLVEIEQCGINVNPDNPVELANAMIELSKDIKKRTILGNNAYRIAETIFNRDFLAKEYTNICNDVIKKCTY